VATTSDLEKRTRNLNFCRRTWNHGAGKRPGKSLVAIPFGSDTSVYFRRRSKRRGCLLAERQRTLPLKEALLFQTGSIRGLRLMHGRREPRRAILFREDGKLSFDAPETSAAAVIITRATRRIRAVPESPGGYDLSAGFIPELVHVAGARPRVCGPTARCLTCRPRIWRGRHAGRQVTRNCLLQRR